MAQGVEDFGTAFQKSDTRGMLQSGAAVIANGIGAGQAAVNVLARGFKEAGLEEVGKIFENRRKDFADLKSVADGLQFREISF